MRKGPGCDYDNRNITVLEIELCKCSRSNPYLDHTLMARAKSVYSYGLTTNFNIERIDFIG